MPEKLKLKVSGHILASEMLDHDSIPMISWQDIEPAPCAYFDAFEDSLDFLDKDWLKEEQHESPDRHLFIFNRMPESQEEVKEAINSYFD